MEIKRYLLTSAQNNTPVNMAAWNNILALANHYKAQVMVGTYTYNKGSIGASHAKRKTSQEKREAEWWDSVIEPYIADQRVVLAPGIEWCGEMQILPTATDPLSGMQGYTARASSIFPHAKIAMASVPSGLNELTKLMYTTGSVTGPNYIQKKAGLKAQFHHSIGCLVVEVDKWGGWWVRQISAGKDGTLHDLDIVARNGKVSRDTEAIEGIVWGDIHVDQIDPIVAEACWGIKGMLNDLHPKHQFFHDLFDGQSVRKHSRAQHLHHEMYRVYSKGKWSVQEEVQKTYDFLVRAKRFWCKSVVVNSNHDQMLQEWLQSTSHKTDPENAIFYLKAELFVHDWVARYSHKSSPPLLQWAITTANPTKSILWALFLEEDESFILCPDANGGIECGMHGHRGPNGARGTIKSFARMGRKSVVGHSHTAGIFEGCYQVGLSGRMNLIYNKGPSSWTHTHCVIYKNGKRTLVTIHNGKWRA